MEVHRLEREFVYNGVKLPDTTPTMTPEQVRETYTHLYPEIATAAIEGPETVAGKLVYRFVRAIGAQVATIVFGVHRRLGVHYTEATIPWSVRRDKR
jgi:PRTRC genetic system protein C